MSDYSPPLKQMSFLLNSVAGLPEVAATERYAEAAPDMAEAMLTEAGRFISEQIAPINRPTDIEGVRFENGNVRMPAAMKQAWDGYRALGLAGLTADPDFGGLGFPQLLFAPIQEMTSAGSLSFVQTSMLNLCAIEALQHHARDDLKALYIPKMAAGDWTGTMNLTEPQAGSDLGAIRTRARRGDDGTYRIKGQKIFITSGDHDLSENIIHLVLARLDDAPEGSRGLSLFLVPKILPNADGSLGDANDLRCGGIEEKMGLHASSACTMVYGEADGATGFLIGEVNRGLQAMFTMMNGARLHVGLQAVGCAERAYQMAAAYADDRVQGKPVGGKADAPIRDHPDVRRMLMTMRAKTSAARAICYMNARALDFGNLGDRNMQALAEVMTPLSKAYSTEIGVEVASDAMQVFGGMGFVEETGIAQIFRDVRITPIYEGTNGIQAWDLVNRKLNLNDGTAFQDFLSEISAFLDGIEDRAELSAAANELRKAVGAVGQVAAWLRDCLPDRPRAAAAGAVPFLRMTAECAGSWLLLKGAAAALQRMDKGDSDQDFLRAQVALAEFHARRLLPVSVALGRTAMNGDEPVFSADPQALLA